MAVAKKCDICGALYELYNMKNSEKNWNAVQFYNRDMVDSHFSHGIKDICPDCQKAIGEVVEKLKGERT